MPGNVLYVDLANGTTLRRQKKTKKACSHTGLNIWKKIRFPQVNYFCFAIDFTSAQKQKLINSIILPTRVQMNWSVFTNLRHAFGAPGERLINEPRTARASSPNETKRTMTFSRWRVYFDNWGHLHYSEGIWQRSSHFQRRIEYFRPSAV